MTLALSDFDLPKANWIHKISEAFRTCAGYFENESENEIEVQFKNVEGANLKLFFRTLPSNDVDEFCSVFLKKKYKFITSLILRVYPCPNKKLNILDLDVNSGFSTIYFNLMFPDATIFCIESEYSNYCQLLKHVKGNKLTRIRVLNQGSWDRSRTLKCNYYPNQYTVGHFGLFPEVAAGNEGNPTGLLHFVTLEGIFENFGLAEIDIFRIDAKRVKVSFKEENYWKFIFSMSRIIIICNLDDFADRVMLLSIILKIGFEYHEPEETIFAWKTNV
jgi:FkbM family methyltransferase